MKNRKSKISKEEFAVPFTSSDILNLLPGVGAGKQFQEIIKAVENAVHYKKPVIFAFGAHIIKCGLSLLIIDLMKKGFLNFLATTGASVIHDVEIALFGKTSEKVEETLPAGKFGMAKEANDFINKAIKNYGKSGYGEKIGKALWEKEAKHKDYSIFAQSYRQKIPLTVHIAIGTDVNQMHPSYSPELSARASYIDFITLGDKIKEVGEGGVIFNVGSAVILPEVILKCFSLAGNLGYNLSGSVGVNFDMIKNYRSETQIVNRVKLLGGQGYSIVGSHEILIPLLYRALVK